MCRAPLWSSSDEAIAVQGAVISLLVNQLSVLDPKMI